MKRRHDRLSPFLLFFVLVTEHWLLITCATAQGPLSPPGSPGPTFKTLQQVEPRIPITNVTFTITLPGSYYMVTNLTQFNSFADGIVIQSDDVTVDLNGFALYGFSDASGGIVVSGNRKNITIRNGSLSAWENSGAIVAGTAHNLQIENVRVYNNFTGGIVAGSNSLVRGCMAEANNGGGGITVGPASIVVECTAKANSIGITVGKGCTISGSTAYNNNGNGITLDIGSTIHDCASYLNAGIGISASDACEISDCSVYGSTLDGIVVANGCNIHDNDCRSNGNGGNGAGIRVSGDDNRIDSNHCTGNDRGIDVEVTGNLVIRNSARGNAGGSSNFVFVAGVQHGGITNLSGPFTNTNPWVNFSY